MSNMLEFAGDAPEVKFAPGDVIIEEGKPLDSLYILKEGEVEVRRDMMTIGRISKRGSALGEISALLGVPSTGSAVAVTPCTFAVIEGAGAFLARHHGAALEVARNLAHRLNWMTKTYVDQIYDDI